MIKFAFCIFCLSIGISQIECCVTVDPYNNTHTVSESGCVNFQ